MCLSSFNVVGPFMLKMRITFGADFNPVYHDIRHPLTVKFKKELAQAVGSIINK